MLLLRFCRGLACLGPWKLYANGTTQGRPLQFEFPFSLSFPLKPPYALKLKNSLHLHRFYNLFVIKQLQRQKNQKGEP